MRRGFKNVLFLSFKVFLFLHLSILFHVNIWAHINYIHFVFTSLVSCHKFQCSYVIFSLFFFLQIACWLVGRIPWGPHSFHAYISYNSWFLCHIYIWRYFNVGGVGSSLVLKVCFIYPMVVRWRAWSCFLILFGIFRKYCLAW